MKFGTWTNSNMQNSMEMFNFSAFIGITVFGQITHLLAEAVAMEWWKRKTRGYHQKLNVKVASRIAEQFKTNNLKK